MFKRQHSLLPLLSMALLLSTSASAGSFFSNGFIDTQQAALDEHITHYQHIVEKGGWPALRTASKLEVGANHDGVATLKQILSLTGDYKASNSNINPHAQSTTLFDAELEAAVKQFQSRHGLDADGVVGTATRKALNVPAVERLAQLHVTKQRLDEFEQTAQSEHSIIVNIPGYTLYTMEKDKAVGEMKVIVGRADRRTPQFTNQITYLDFNPRWYVPQSIATKDLLPKIKNNPNFISSGGFTLTQNGESINANQVDWSAYSRGNFPFQLTQRSGSSNALGKVKFHLPDNQAIYLHDTAKPELFEKGYRALSSGCVRVENPIGLAEFVLSRGGANSEKTAEELYNSSAQQRVSLETPITVHTVYWTAWVEPGAKQPHFYGDIYNKDQPLIADKTRELEGTLQVASN